MFLTLFDPRGRIVFNVVKTGKEAVSYDAF